MSGPSHPEYIGVQPVPQPTCDYRWYVRCRDPQSGQFYAWWASPRFKDKRRAQAFLERHQTQTLF